MYLLNKISRYQARTIVESKESIRIINKFKLYEIAEIISLL